MPIEQVFDGGPGKDGIPALLNPAMVPANQGSYLSANDLVVGVKVGSQTRAYPHQLLDWHEIVNDAIGDSVYAVTYCPLTGSAVNWSRRINGEVTTFGVSGLLYNTNLMPYDRGSNSTWSQMRTDCVNGELMGRECAILPVVETTWETWKTLYPNTQVASNNTGFGRPYGNYPYGDYRTNHSRLLFPVTPLDSRLPGKTRVLGINTDSGARAYEIGRFGDSVRVVEDVVGGTPLVVVGNASMNFAAAFSKVGNESPTFTALQDDLPAVMIDDLGNRYDLFGAVIGGPDVGNRLASASSYVAYWVAWAAFHPGSEIASF